jgi:hypothetical protein
MEYRNDRNINGETDGKGKVLAWVCSHCNWKIAAPKRSTPDTLRPIFAMFDAHKCGEHKGSKAANPEAPTSP